MFRQSGPASAFTKEDMNSSDKRKILETFVENDNALSLMLDFISNKHINKSGAIGGAGETTENFNSRLNNVQSG